MYAAVSFAVLLIAVGVPLWWKTTEVYRVHVPYGHIAELQEKELFFNINVHVHSKKNNLKNLEEGVQKYSNFGEFRSFKEVLINCNPGLLSNAQEITRYK